MNEHGKGRGLGPGGLAEAWLEANRTTENPTRMASGGVDGPALTILCHLAVAGPSGLREPGGLDLPRARPRVMGGGR